LEAPSRALPPQKPNPAFPLIRVKKWLRRIVRLTGLAVLGWIIFLYLVPLFFSLPDGLTTEKDPSTILTDRNGEPLRRFLVNGEEVISAYVSLDQIPTDLINATVSAEDKRFWDHGGVDFAAMLRATHDVVRKRWPVSGASTISQQLIKITTDPPRPRTLKTKAFEVFSARKMEMFHSKDWILENYLNRLPYGNLRMGCVAAAEGYFDKPLGELSLAECALIAGLPNKPTRFNPYKNFEGAKRRQIWILNRMVEDGHITDEERERAEGENLVIVHGGGAFQAPHAVDLIVARHSQQLLPGEVRSTIDLDLQNFATQAIDEHLNFIASKRDTSPFMHAAAVVIENATGEILVLSGSRDYDSSAAGQINGAWTPRSPGSALKPFTYLVALERGFPASTVLPDIQTDFSTPTGVYRPVNYDRTFSGPTTIRQALGNSLNIPAVRILNQLGGPEPLYDALVNLGLTTLTEPYQTYGLGMTIGTAEVRLLELTNAYACLARLGEWRPYVLLAEEDPTESKQLFSEETCYLIADILSDPESRSRSFGWINPLNFKDFKAAAKTGTSSDYRDAWTLGFTPEFTVGVWVGNFDNTPLDHFSGVAGAGPIFHKLLKRLHEDIEPTWFTRPSSVVSVEIDPFSGRQARGTGVRELVLETSPPPHAVAADYDEQGRTLLSPIYGAWLEAASPAVNRRLAIAPAAAGTPLRILSPLEGMTIVLDPDIANGGRILPLRANLGEKPRWSSRTLEIDEESQTAILSPGEHELIAENPETGDVDRVIFRVTGR
jgi:penicillin-binding protein 1C